MNADSSRVDVKNTDGAEDVRTDAGEEYESAGVAPSVQQNGRTVAGSLSFFSSTVKPLALCLRFARIKQPPDDVGLTDAGPLEGPLRRCPNGWSTQSSLCC